jgi:hypothetical protein
MPSHEQAVGKRPSGLRLKSPSPLSLFNNLRKLLFQQPVIDRGDISAPGA